MNQPRNPISTDTHECTAGQPQPKRCGSTSRPTAEPSRKTFNIDNAKVFVPCHYQAGLSLLLPHGTLARVIKTHCLSKGAQQARATPRDAHEGRCNDRFKSAKSYGGSLFHRGAKGRGPSRPFFGDQSAKWTAVYARVTSHRAGAISMFAYACIRCAEFLHHYGKK